MMVTRSVSIGQCLLKKVCHRRALKRWGRNFSQKPLSPQTLGGDVHCCCGNCLLALPHRSVTIINLTPATRTTVDDVVQR
jgi:hypothetical protein